MKKLVLSTLCTLAVAGVAFAQNNVRWDATGLSAANVSFQTNAIVFSPLFGGGAAGGVQGNTGASGSGFTGANAYYYALLYQGPTSGTGSWTGSQLLGGSAPSNSLSTLLTFNDSGLYATNSAAHFASVVSPNTGDPVPWGNSTTNNIVLVGWSADLGALGTGQETWLNVSNVLAHWSSQSYGSANYFFGVSTAGYLDTTSATPGANPTGNGTGSAFGLPINSLNTQLYLLPTPEPTTIALAGLGGLSLLLFRRRKV